MDEVTVERSLMSSFEPEYDEDGNIVDFVTETTLENPGPEEPVRQWYEHVLVEEYNYDKGQIDIEIPITMGSSTKYADIGVYESTDQLNLKILVENKKPDRTDGVSQLESYMEASGVSLGVWTNGAGIQHMYRPEPREFESISDIPEAGETLSSMDSRITKEELSPATDLVSIFEQAEDDILAHQGGIDVFDELFKIILTKIYDEVENLHSPDAVAEFRAGPMEEPETVASRIERQFEGSNDHGIIGVKRKYDDVFDGDEDIQLSDENIARVVGLLQNIEFMETDMDVLGTGFEALVPDQMKEEKGQYFTPRQVVRMTTELVDPERYESVLDPTCGSGGFLIYTMRKLRDELLEERGEENMDEVMELVRDYASNRAYGLDYDQRLVRVAKAYMVIWGDGRSNIRQVQDSLRYFDWPGEISALIPENEFEVILTNPPFAGDFDVQNTTEYYDLATRNGTELETQEKDILFTERCIKHLEPGGRMGIVLPKGDLDEKGKSYFREYIKEKTKIKAVIGLHENTFLPYTGDKTCVLVLEKRSDSDEEDQNEEGQDEEDEVFMAVSQKPGKNDEGEQIYKRNSDGELIKDEDGMAVLDTDLPQIADEYHSNDEPDIGYYVPHSELEDRLNPQYYHPKYDAVDEQLDKVDLVVTIDELLDPDESYALINGKDISSLSNTGKREYVEDGTPYLRAGDVGRNEIDLDDCNRVPYTADDLREYRQLVAGDILISRKGTTGRVSVVTEKEVHSIISSEVMKLSLRNAVMDPDGEMRDVDPFYVSAFLNSHFGKLQIERHLTGSVSQGINQTDLKAVKIPLPEEDVQDEIAERYREVRDLRTKIENLDEEALQLADRVGDSDNE